MANAWYYNPSTDQYRFTDPAPASPWKRSSTPTPVISHSMGGFIKGSGFGQGATATVGGSSTTVTVVNQHLAYFVSNRAYDGVAIVFTNPDSTVANFTSDGDFTKSPAELHGGQWGIHQIDARISPQERAD